LILASCRLTFRIINNLARKMPMNFRKIRSHCGMRRICRRICDMRIRDLFAHNLTHSSHHYAQATEPVSMPQITAPSFRNCAPFFCLFIFLSTFVTGPFGPSPRSTAPLIAARARR
jgi:hypothetical protein